MNNRNNNNSTGRGAPSDAPGNRARNPLRLHDEEAPHRTVRLPLFIPTGRDTSRRNAQSTNEEASPGGTLGEASVGERNCCEALYFQSGLWRVVCF